MTDALFDQQDDAATPLEPADRDGLLLTHITMRGELNEAEQLNITEAEVWAFKGTRDVLSETFLRTLHKRMFGKVWRWAGAWSQAQDRRVGVDHWLIEPALRALLDDVRYWVAHQSFPPDEIAARFHHKLTWIHPFPNGNGRMSRMAADLLLVSLCRPRFTWGSVNLVNAEGARDRYVAALRAADRHDIGPLLAFVRT